MIVRTTYTFVLIAIMLQVTHGRSLTKKRENFYQADVDNTVLNNETSLRNARYLYIRKNGVLHPVINATTVAVHAGYATLIGLGFLSVLNSAAKQLAAKSSSSTNDDKDTNNDIPKHISSSSITNSTTRYRKKRKRPFSYTFTTLPSIEPYDDINIDFEDVVDQEDDDVAYEEELRQYEKDYEQYLKDYAKWNKTYGDLYRNAESSMIVASSSHVDSYEFRLKPKIRKRKQR